MSRHRWGYWIAVAFLLLGVLRFLLGNGVLR